MRPIQSRGTPPNASSIMVNHAPLDLDQKNYLRQKNKDDRVPPVLDSLDNYKMLSERMNVLAIYLPCRKLLVASDLRKVRTAVPGMYRAPKGLIWTHAHIFIYFQVFFCRLRK
jgi:hypothetical protein